MRENPHLHHHVCPGDLGDLDEEPRRVWWGGTGMRARCGEVGPPENPSTATDGKTTA